MGKRKTVVYFPGVWDLLHIGHVTILEKAKKLGDILIVGVPTDAVVFEDKECLPIISCEHRVRMLRALKCVDDVAEYGSLEFITALVKFDANILVVGETWGSDKRHTEATAYMEAKGGNVVQFGYTKGVSSTSIKEKIVAQDWAKKS